MKLLTIPWCEAEAKLILSFLVPSPLLTGLEHTNWNNKKPNWILQCTAEEPLQATAALAWRQRNPDNGDPAFPGDLPLLNPCHSCKEKSKSPNEHALRAHKEKKKKKEPKCHNMSLQFSPTFPLSWFSALSRASQEQLWTLCHQKALLGRSLRCQPPHWRQEHHVGVLPGKAVLLSGSSPLLLHPSWGDKRPPATITNHRAHFSQLISYGISTCELF